MLVLLSALLPIAQSLRSEPLTLVAKRRFSAGQIEIADGGRFLFTRIYTKSIILKEPWKTVQLMEPAGDYGIVAAIGSQGRVAAAVYEGHHANLASVVLYRGEPYSERLKPFASLYINGYVVAVRIDDRHANLFVQSLSKITAYSYPSLRVKWSRPAKLASMFSLSKDGNRLAYFSKRHLQIRRTADGTLLASVPLKWAPVFLDFSGDGNRLCLAGMSKLGILDIGRALVRTRNIHEGLVCGCKFLDSDFLVLAFRRSSKVKGLGWGGLKVFRSGAMKLIQQLSVGNGVDDMGYDSAGNKLYVSDVDDDLYVYKLTGKQ